MSGRLTASSPPVSGGRDVTVAGSGVHVSGTIRG
jgi:hypothetical protein